MMTHWYSYRCFVYTVNRRTLILAYYHNKHILQIVSIGRTKNLFLYFVIDRHTKSDDYRKSTSHRHHIRRDTTYLVQQDYIQLSL